ncbi:fluoride efflux transporter FluC [Actinomadura syzygii]|uniref:Fluoride-specific ion channel FluC n=1 Tax=Actinomadura syzygii TaxID=1427538 RepID=A0A5D0TUK2_9ACTN|nr:CrcB family protein [Actinomadura syzygii]TYC08992.1 CrcB family protein [Actinomadura syzygii]
MSDARPVRPEASPSEVASKAPDIDLRVPPRRRWDLGREHWSTLAAISAGGVCGALARYGISTALPHRSGAFDWAIFVINVSGCLLIGVLMVLITEVWRAHRLVRPFLGVGILGGYTTFSTALVEVQRGVQDEMARSALLYLFGTLVCALLAVQAGVWLTRLLSRPRTRAAADGAGDEGKENA